MKFFFQYRNIIITGYDRVEWPFGHHAVTRLVQFVIYMDRRKDYEVDDGVPGTINDNGINFLQSNKSVRCVDFCLIKIISKYDL